MTALLQKIYILAVLVASSRSFQGTQINARKQRADLYRLGTKQRNRADDGIGMEIISIPNKMVKRADEAISSVTSTIDEIRNIPRKVADDIDKNVNNIVTTIDASKNIATDVYNAPGYYLDITQTKFNNLKRRKEIIEKEGFVTGLISPLDEEERQTLSNLTSEERAASNRESLKNSMAMALDITEQAFLLGVEGVKRTPDAIEKVKELVEEAKSIPQKVVNMKESVESFPDKINRLKEERLNQAGELQLGFFDTWNNAVKWVTLEEPKRLTQEAIDSATVTRQGVESLVKDVKGDMDSVIEIFRGIPSAIMTTKMQMGTLPSKVGAAIKEIQSDINNTKESVMSMPAEIKNKKQEILQKVDQTKGRVTQAAEQINSFANSAGAAINKVGSDASGIIVESKQGKKRV